MAADGAAALNESVFWDGYYVLGADIECDYGEGFYPSVSWPNPLTTTASIYIRRTPDSWVFLTAEVIISTGFAPPVSARFS